MEQITSNVYVENGVRGCNHGFVTTSDGIVLIDTPQKPSDALRLKAEIERHGPIRYIINTEPHGDHWLDTLDMLRELPEESFVPGHGPLCDKAYLNEQEAWIREWLAYVKNAIERGMTKEDAVTALTDMTDRYPMDVEQDGMAPMVMKMNVANIWDFITGEGIHSKA